MGNFATIFGFLFSFLLLMMIIPGLLFLYEREVDAKVSDLKNYESNLVFESQRIEVVNFFYSLGRVYVDFCNGGSQEIFLSSQAGSLDVCFDVFCKDEFVERRGFFLKDYFLFDDYSFVESGEEGVFYFLFDDLFNLSVKFVSCNGVSQSYDLDLDRLSWSDLSYGSRERFVFENDEDKFWNQSYNLVVNESSLDFDFSLENKRDLSFVWDLEENNLILGLSFDEYSQSLQDFSKLDNRVYLGGNRIKARTDPLEVDGVFFSGLSFDGVRQYSKVSENLGLVVEDELSVCAFVKWNSSDDANSLQNVFTNGAWHNAVRIVNDGSLNDGKVLFELSVDSKMKYLYSDSRIDENWHLICAVYDANNMKIYIDDKLDSVLQVEGQIDSVLASNYVGSESIFGYFFNGVIDELKVFNTALSLEQVKNVFYNRPLLEKLDFRILEYDEVSKYASFQIDLPFVEARESANFYMYFDKEDVVS